MIFGAASTIVFLALFSLHPFFCFLSFVSLSALTLSPFATTNREGQQRLELGRREQEDIVKEFDETRRQIEEDADREIEQQKHEYEEKLAQERQATLRLKGENNLMAKKFR